VCGDDAIVEDVVNVGLRGKAAQCGDVVLLGCGLDCSDAEVLVTTCELSAGRGDASFSVAGDGGVAIEDEVAMGSDAGGVDLGVGETGEEEGEEKYEDDGAFAGGVAERRNGHGRHAKSWRTESQVAINGHGCTSLLR